jgi:hypothetical protein
MLVVWWPDRAAGDRQAAYNVYDLSRATKTSAKSHRGISAAVVEKSAEQNGATMSTRSVVRVTRSTTWSEASHPRYPAGDDRGGQFAPKVAGQAAAWAERAAATTTLHRSEKIHALEEQLFGRSLTAADYISLTGALAGGQIRVSTQGPRLHIRVNHPQFRSHRIIQRAKDGTLVMHNEDFALKKNVARGTGIGARVLARQVDGVYRMGITKITTVAGGDAAESHSFPEALNGWYTWARLGYNAAVPSSIARLLHREPATSPLRRLAERPSITLHDLFDAPGGADFWWENGNGFDGEFDPRPDSPHYARLWKRLYVKGIDPYAED